MRARSNCAASRSRTSSGKDNITNALVEYAQGTGEWSAVKDAYVNGWATEWATNEESLGMLPQAEAFNAEG